MDEDQFDIEIQALHLFEGNNASNIISSSPSSPSEDMAKLRRKLGKSTRGKKSALQLKPHLVKVNSPPVMDIYQKTKRPRLTREFKALIQQPPLVNSKRVIQMKKEPVYRFQIPPTFESERGQSHSPQRVLKENIHLRMSRLDKKINHSEHEELKLLGKLQELEASESIVLREVVEEISPVESQQMNFAHVIYSANKIKAQKSHAVFENFGPEIEIPLYNQPSDTVIYHENKRRFVLFKNVLVNRIRQGQRERELKEEYLTKTYRKLMQEWHMALESRERRNRTKKVRDAKRREFFEKEFPVLKKEREEKERFLRNSQRVRSDAEWKENIGGSQEQEIEKKRIHARCVTPPILLDVGQSKLSYINRNGLIKDLSQEYREREMLNVWTDQEKELFRKKYLQYPKNFAVIASYFEKKCVTDCVQYYYLSKRRENYKHVLKQHGVKKRPQ